MHLVHQHVASQTSEASSATGTLPTGLCDHNSGSQGSGTDAKHLSFSESPVDTSRACCYELCAGLVDKSGKSLEAIAQEEVLEECGYSVPLESIRRVTSYQSNVGTAGSRQFLFFATVSLCVEKDALFCSFFLFLFMYIPVSGHNYLPLLLIHLMLRPPVFFPCVTRRQST